MIFDIYFEFVSFDVTTAIRVIFSPNLQEKKNLFINSGNRIKLANNHQNVIENMKINHYTVFTRKWRLPKSIITERHNPYFKNIIHRLKFNGLLISLKWRGFGIYFWNSVSFWKRFELKIGSNVALPVTQEIKCCKTLALSIMRCLRTCHSEIKERSFMQNTIVLLPTRVLCTTL